MGKLARNASTTSPQTSFKVRSVHKTSKTCVIRALWSSLWGKGTGHHVSIFIISTQTALWPKEETFILNIVSYRQKRKSSITRLWAERLNKHCCRRFLSQMLRVDRGQIEILRVICLFSDCSSKSNQDGRLMEEDSETTSSSLIFVLVEKKKSVSWG